MKKIYLFTFLLINLTTLDLHSQVSSDTEKSISDFSNTISSIDRNQDELVLQQLINELESAFESVLIYENDEFKLIVSTFGATNKYALSLKDKDGRSIIDGNLEPNTSTSINLSEYQSESYIVRISDMQTLKTAVYKICSPE